MEKPLEQQVSQIVAFTDREGGIWKRYTEILLIVDYSKLQYLDKGKFIAWMGIPALAAIKLSSGIVYDFVLAEKIGNGWRIPVEEKSLEQQASELLKGVEAATTSIDSVLNMRGIHYGKFQDGARVMQQLKAILFRHNPENQMAPDQIEALEMICHKLGRIVNGDPDYADSWVDIAGYAQLVADRLNGTVR